MKRLVSAFIIFVASISMGFSQDADRKKEFDTKARTVMENVVAHLKGAKTIQVDTLFNVAISSDDPALGGENIKQTLSQQFNLNGRDQFSLVTRGDAAGMGSADAFYDQGVGTVLIAGQGAIQHKDLPDLQAFFTSEKLGYQKEAEMNPFLDQNLAVATLKSLVLHKADEKWDDNITRLSYGGEEEADGIMTHRLGVSAEQNVMGRTQVMNMDIWISKGENPTLVKVVPDMNGFLKAMAEEGGGNPMLSGMKMEVSGEYKGWKINEDIEGKVFVPNLGDIEQYDSFMDLMRAMMGGGGDDPGQQLVGKQAADFDLNLLNGDVFKLSEHRGKNVVILDFWATWCGPCVRALPELMAAADAFKDQNVILIAVNQREKESRIQKFLDKQKWNDLTVALDSDGAVGDLFGVQGIPQTVIVGKDGLIKKVHVGFSPSLKEEISSELKEIIAGH